MNSKNGFGINSSSSSIISPCPSMIDSFFKEQLKYHRVDMKDKNQYLVKYTKTLNQSDNSLFEDLINISCVSNIIIDSYNGNVVNHYFTINKGAEIRSYAECPQTKSVLFIFQWHINLVRLTREYIKGGWLQKYKIKKELESMKDKYMIVNKPGFNMLEKAKPLFEDVK